MNDGESLAGRYRPSGELGRGGMGTVWRARDETLNRDVAVKELVLPRETSEARRELAVQRALREARAAARLRHPSIITVHDVVLADGRPWIVMELLSGRSLDRIVKDDGPLDPRRVAALGIEMLDALSTAHEHGVLHRDVKPANVFLRDDGRAVLTDFGIASLAGDVPLTRPGALIGSPAYMAPERIRGEPGGPPSDLWSLGATLYALVEGRTPFARSTPMGVLGAVLADEPAAPRRAGPLAGLLLRLLAKDPDARPTADQVRRELAESAGIAQSGEVIEDPGPSTRPASVRPKSSRNTAIALAVLACLVGAAATGYALLKDDRSGRRASGPIPIASVPSLCGLISVTQMNRLVPKAGVTGALTEDPPEYFHRYAPATETCEWAERSAISSGYIADIVTQPAKAGPSGDPMRPARDDFARLRHDAATGALPGHYRSAPLPLPGIGDDAIVYVETTGEAQARDHAAVAILRTRNLLTQVRYQWYRKGTPPPGGLGALRDGAIQITRWTDAALRAGRPLAAP
ncbi:serine/threonine-protein kinase [Spirillospora sp. CA-142024]|uniref:serine/threonine-protein kinase n=1 Tax=Spirillospora sp. CA-142024 TaxID=3240036 RepID=UPI003D93FE5B